MFYNDKNFKTVIAAAILIAAGMLAYSNSFHGPFIFDDRSSILENPHIRKLWPVWEPLTAPPERTVSGRPVLSLTLAVNYAISGLNVWSYHAANLVIHILAGLLLFGIIRRTLNSGTLQSLFGEASTTLALACSLIWLLHPLQTESVTYIIQRGESLMGLFYLLTLYCSIRSFNASGKSWWSLAAVLSCALGMGSKEVMVTAPLMVLLYDRVFVVHSFREIFRRRAFFYLALFATWGILGWLVYTSSRAKSAGFDLDITVISYLKAQARVVLLYYLKTAFWPNKLVFDYGWPMANRFSEYGLPGMVLLALLGSTLAAFRYWPYWGYLGGWFFLILAPTSSILPIATEIAAEHRMYLPLASVVVFVVIGGYLVLKRFFSHWLLKISAGALVVVMIVTLGIQTYRRNVTYQSEVSIWQDTIAKRPDNYRAYNNLGTQYFYLGKYDLAVENYGNSIQLKADYAPAYRGRAIAWMNKGMVEQAITDFNEAIRLKPEDFEAFSGRGIANEKAMNFESADKDFSKAIQLNPEYAGAYNNRGSLFIKQGKYESAVRDFTRAIELDAFYVTAYLNRALAHTYIGHYDQAITDYERALQIAQDRGNRHLAESIRLRLEKYKSRHPYQIPSSE